MGTTSLPRIPHNADQQTLINSLNFILEELDHLLNGNVDSKNAREIGGWRVGPKQMESKDKDVGMSTDDTGEDPVRFWAGDVVTGTPAFYVTRSGKLFASNGEFVGKITAESGEIGGFTIGVTTLTDQAGTFGLSSEVTAGDDVRFYAGGTDPATSPFKVTETGKITAIAGAIGGFKLGAAALTDTAGTFGLSSAVTIADDVRFYAGGTNPATAPFRVTESGKATASNLDITGGNINVTSDVSIGEKLYFDPNSFGSYLVFKDGVVYISFDPAGNGMNLVAAGGVNIEGVRVATTKADKSSISKTVYVAGASGAAATTPMTITNGVITG